METLSDAMIFLDTSAWLEYFMGSRRGLKIRAILESEEKTATSLVVLIELSCKAHREGIDFSAQVDFIKQNSVICSLNEELVEDIGKTYAEMRAKNKKVSLPDAIIASTARAHNSYLITCDYDFKGFPFIKFIE